MPILFWLPLFVIFSSLGRRGNGGRRWGEGGGKAVPLAGGCSTGVNRSPEVGDGGGSRWIWIEKRTATVTANDERRRCDSNDRGWLSN